MDLLKWKPSYALGVPSVDHEHRELIQTINEVHTQLEGGGNQQTIEHALGEIHATISAHFALEEQLMSDAQYGEYQAHKNDHEALLDQIRDMMDLYVADPVKGRSVLQQGLSKWFEEHFSTFDARTHHQLG